MARLGMISAIGLAGALTAAVAIAPASAGGGSQLAPDATYSTVIASGGEVARSASEGYLGFYHALNRDLDRDGFIVRLLGTRGFYDYRDGSDKFEGKYWQGDAMIGYQWVRGGIDIATYVGVDFQNYKVTPDDPFNKLRGSEAGFKVAVDIESNGNFNSPAYVAIAGSYSTAFDSYYALGRLGYTFGRVVIGPEAWLLGDETGDAQRLGGFLKFDIPLGGAALGSLALSAGYQFVSDTSSNNFGGGSRFGEEGAYGTLQFQVALGRENAAPLK